MWKLAVVGVIFKENQDGYLILTQRRVVQNRAYDPLYDQTWEAMGETVKEGESIWDTLYRGIREECGCPDFEPLGLLPEQPLDRHWTTGRGDDTECVFPLCYLHSLGEPQPWSGPAFGVRVASDFEPNFELADGEADADRWWIPEELKEAIETNPKQFMGWHIPALYQLATLLKRPRR